MATDIVSQVYASFNLPLQEKIAVFTKIIDQSSPFKDLQILFPQLVSNIFGESLSRGWGLRAVTPETSHYDFVALHNFLEPQGPMFRLCYKLLADPQLKYSLPLHQLPSDLQHLLQRGRYSQFYADLLNVDTQTISVVALALNPFDYYIFHFALHLLNSSVNKFLWENHNSAYFALACDYLTHFLPTDPMATVLPQIPYYTGKTPVIAPLQTANRPLHPPSLLLVQDLPGLNIQRTSNSSQSQPRNEVWRSETILQVFMDIWMSVDEFSQNISGSPTFSRNCPLLATTGERVRVTRMLVKQVHAFSSQDLTDPIPRSSALRKYARQCLCARAYHFVRHLVTTWPLDASFRLVLELWLSLIQPWRYAGHEDVRYERYPGNFLNRRANNQEDTNKTVDSSYTQFIAENFPLYTCIFQLILPRFMRLDLTAPKNTVTLFRICKVFSQQNLVPMLIDIERAACEHDTSGYRSPGQDLNGSRGQNYSSNGILPNKWGAVAKQAIAELNLSPNFCYQPMWGEESREAAYELVMRIGTSKINAEKNVAALQARLQQQNQGFWSFLKFSMVMGSNDEEEVTLEERKKVPAYLATSLQQLCSIFGFDESLMISSEQPLEEVPSDNSLSLSSSQFPFSTSPQVRNKSTNIKYMGDPDLVPIGTHESTILVRILYHIASRINELYENEMQFAWRRNDFWGDVSREVLQTPCTIHNYTKGGPTYRNIVSKTLPPRLSLRKMGSYAFIVWISIGYILTRLLGYGGILYIVLILVLYVLFVFFKAFLRTVGALKPDNLNNTLYADQ